MNNSNKGNQNSNFKSSPSPSTKMLALVTIAIIVGFIFVWIVNNNSKSNLDNSTTKAQTVNTKAKTNSKASKSKSKTTTTTTTTVVSNTQKPSSVSILVLNGSQFGGVAANTATEIGKLGYKVLASGDDSSKDVGTFVYYKTGFEPDATNIAKNIMPGILKVLQIPQKITIEQFPSSTPSQWAVSELLNANVVVIVGNVS